MPNSLVHDRYCAEIIEQTRLFRETIADASLSAQVPSCPDWTLRELAVHVGNAHRWAGEIVRSRATSAVSPKDVPGFDGPEQPTGDTGAGTDAAGLDAWLAEGAQLLSDELRVAGEETPVWTWFTEQRAGFWARRMTHETLVHRSDAALTAGVEFEADAEVAADCVDEWLEIATSPLAAEHNPPLRTLGERAGATLHLHATDTSKTAAAEWLITLGESDISWLRAHEKADVALRGRLTDVLLVFLRRLPATSDRVEVLGDAELLDFWLERVRFE